MSPFNPLPSVVAFGGGHGLSASLSALRQVTTRLTAVVTVADDGGSSGRLRAEFPSLLPPGDLRMALAALCGDDEVGRSWSTALQARFPGEGPLGGHSIGNLLIASLWQQLDDPIAGLDTLAAMLYVEGRVLPMSSIPLVIEADVIGADPVRPDERTVVVGQEAVALAVGEIADVRLVPADPPAVPEVLAAVARADYLVLGPGSWYSSVIPHLLVPELVQAITASRARKVLTLNLVPTEDETPAYTASRHIEVLAEHAPELRLDVVVADPSFADGDPHLATYVASLGAELVIAPVRMRDGSARHDPLLLASVYAGIMGL